MNYISKVIFLIVLICIGFSQGVFADSDLQVAINGMQRSEANKSRDAARHPQETLEFFGIKPTMTVIELMPGSGGWYTEILAPYLKPQGELIEALQDPETKSEYGRNTFVRFQKKLTVDPEIYGKIKMTIFEPPTKLNFAPNNSADMVLTFRNIHNWMSNGDDTMKVIFENIYASLKKGGVFGVVEHRLPTTRSKANGKEINVDSGYVSEEYVIKLAESVGFKLVAKSEINANPKDNADHKGGVWALPPTFVNKGIDRQKYAEIGESDRMTLKFIK